MNQTIREQLIDNVRGSEEFLQHLKSTPEANHDAIAGQEREVAILNRKLESTPQDAPGYAPYNAHS